MKSNLPTLALSVRQPWAWAIIHGGRDVDNRKWSALGGKGSLRGRVCIHASLAMNKGYYESAAHIMKAIDVICPPANQLPRGGIVGTVEIIDNVSHSQSIWFTGPRALVLRDPQACTPIPCKGHHEIFEWEESGTLAKQAAWMRGRTSGGITRPLRRIGLPNADGLA